MTVIRIESLGKPHAPQQVLEARVRTQRVIQRLNFYSICARVSRFHGSREPVKGAILLAESDVSLCQWCRRAERFFAMGKTLFARRTLCSLLLY
jgi:hypothetical protein